MLEARVRYQVDAIVSEPFLLVDTMPNKEARYEGRLLWHKAKLIRSVTSGGPAHGGVAKAALSVVEHQRASANALLQFQIERH
jgi:hypothetical protein